MIKIDEPKKELRSIKHQFNCRNKLVAENNCEILLKSQILFFEEQIYFIKTKLQQKQIVIEKRLDIQKK